MTTARRIVALLSALFLLPLLAVTTGPWSSAGASPPSAADDSSGLFTPISAAGLRQAGTTRPASYVANRADLARIRATLARPGTVRIGIPDPSGETSTFTVVESPVLAAELQQAHPEIRTYRGAAADGSSIRLDVTPFGFHAMVRMPDGKAWYVDPALRKTGEDRVLSYAGAAVPAPDKAFVERHAEVSEPSSAARSAAPASSSLPGGAVTQRTYRLALLTDPTYAQYVAPGATTHATSDALVLAAKATLVNRINEIYDDDLGIRFEMIVGSDRLNLLTEAEASGPDGPCGANPCFAPGELDECDGEELDRMEFALGQLVGADSYDLGHLALGVDGGGVAYLGVVGGLGTDPGFGNVDQANKGGGCTGLSDPTGDFYAIDYVAHEIGHQMGSDHSFNGVEGACGGGNRDSIPFDIQAEPGSGSSVMAYAGICGSDDLQPHSDPYFSYASNDVINATTSAAPEQLEEGQSVNLAGFAGADAFTLSCAGCSTSPVVTSGSDYNATELEAAVLAATGRAGEVTGYDDGPLNRKGFTVTWPASAGDVPTLTLTPTSGTFTTFTGTIRQGGPTTNQGATVVTANRAPVVTAPAARTLPKQTPFTLTGGATDPDGDPLTYLWEQADPGGVRGTALASNLRVNGPLFRQFGTAALVSDADSLLYHSPGQNLAGTSPSRTFPDLAQILGGTTNAATGACPAAPRSGDVPQATVDCFSEFLPTASWVGDPATPRVMHFRLTARDEFSADAAPDHAGGSSYGEVALTVDPAAGPFLVTSRPAGGVAAGVENVTWDVAGTAGAALAPQVRISLSTDGGLTFPTVLAASTPNDGSESVLLPNLTTGTARIKVEAVGNYFFDVNDANFSIAPAARVADAKAKYRSPKGSSKKVKKAVGKAKLTFDVQRGSAPFGTATFRFKKGKVDFAGTVASAGVVGKRLTTVFTGSNNGRVGFTLVVVAVDKGAKKKDKVRVRLLEARKVAYDSAPGVRPKDKVKTRVKGVTIG